MAQIQHRRFRRNRTKVRGGTETPPVTPSETRVSVDDVVRSIYHDGVLPPRGSTIYVANEVPLGILHRGRDWEEGAALHADARPDPASGAPYHGAPWDWTINGVLETSYQYHNVWREETAYVRTGLPHGVRVQWRNIKAWVIPANLAAWIQTLGEGAGGSYHTSSGRPSGGYFYTTPIYAKTQDIGGWNSPGVTVNGYHYPASPGAKWRVESADNGGGWSTSLDPMIDPSGNLIDDFAISHGPFVNTTSPDRIKIPAGGYFAHWGEARLIMDDYSDVPASAKFTATLGADIFTAQTAAGDPSTARNTSACNPRHRVLPTDGSWVGIGHCAGSAHMIRNVFPRLPFVNA